MRPSILMWRELDAKNLLVLYFSTMLQSFFGYMNQVQFTNQNF